MNDLLEREPDVAVPPPPRAGRSERAHRWLVLAAVAVVAVVVAALALGGTRQSGSGGEPGGASSGSTAADGAAVARLPQPAAASPGAADSGAPSVATAGPGAKIVKTGEMDLQVPKGRVPHTLDRLTAIASLQRGYVADSHTAEGTDPSGSVTLRVPVGAFESTMVQVRQLDAKVLSQQVAGVDVTGKYVDLQARLRSLQATRSAFERLLARATTIGDTLAVQSRITDVQTQIEQLQGELRVLADQTGYGTLTVSVSERADAVARAHPRSGMSAAVHRSVDRFVRGIEAIVGILGPMLLVLLLAGLGWLVVRLGYRVVRGRAV